MIKYKWFRTILFLTILFLLAPTILVWNGTFTVGVVKDKYIGLGKQFDLYLWRLHRINGESYNGLDGWEDCQCPIIILDDGRHVCLPYLKTYRELEIGDVFVGRTVKAIDVIPTK